MYRVMIADDEITIREGITNFINWNKLNCSLQYIACDGISAIKYLQTASIDILITDIRMPGKSGLDIAQFIFDNKYSTKIIILSGYSDFKYAQKALQLGVIDFILKDNPIEKIETAVTKAISELEEQKGNVELLQDMKQSIDQKEEELRIKFFLDLINNVPLSAEKLAEKSKVFCPDSTSIYCILFHIRLTGDNIVKIDDAFLDSLTKFLSTVYVNCKPTIFPLQAHMICMILNNTSSLSESPLIPTLNQLFALTDSFKDYKMKIAISSMHRTISDLSRAYLECMYCFKQNASSQKNIFFYNDEDISSPPCNVSIIKKSIDYMKLNYASQITLNDVANHVSLNPSYLSRKFKKEIGDTLTGYLAKIRVEKAKQLLSDESLRLSEISEFVGFNDPSYFSNTFKKITGYSPTDFRTIASYKSNEF